MITKTRELLFIYHRATVPVNQVDLGPSEQHLERLEEAVFQVSEQLAALGTQRPKLPQCYRCAKPQTPCVKIQVHANRGHSVFPMWEEGPHTCTRSMLKSDKQQRRCLNPSEGCSPLKLTTHEPKPMCIPTLSDCLNPTGAAFQKLCYLIAGKFGGIIIWQIGFIKRLANSKFGDFAASNWMT